MFLDPYWKDTFKHLNAGFPELTAGFVKTRFPSDLKTCSEESLTALHDLGTHLLSYVFQETMRREGWRESNAAGHEHRLFRALTGQKSNGERGRFGDLFDHVRTYLNANTNQVMVTSEPYHFDFALFLEAQAILSKGPATWNVQMSMQSQYYPARTVLIRFIQPWK
jgi:hypothetical protein